MLEQATLSQLSEVVNIGDKIISILNVHFTSLPAQMVTM